MKTNQISKYYFLLINFLLFISLSFGQNDEPREVTTQILKKIKSDVDKEASDFTKTLTKRNLNSDEIEFSIDTFKIEEISSKCMEIDYSTTGMNNAINVMTDSYDKLLNKYYKKLIDKLKPEDKKILIQAQKSWVAFRDSEIKFIGIMAQDEYSGGGTIQSLNSNSALLNIVKQRTIEIFNYLNNILKE